MKIVTEIGFDELLDSDYFDRNSEGAEFVGDIDTMNLGDEFMQILDRQFDNYPEMSELVGYIETNVNDLADKMDLVAVDDGFKNNLDDLMKQIQIASEQSSGEMFDLLDELSVDIENVKYGFDAAKYSEKSSIEMFVDNCLSAIRRIRSLNTFENDNYDSLNQILTNMEQDLDKMDQII